MVTSTQFTNMQKEKVCSSSTCFVHVSDKTYQIFIELTLKPHKAPMGPWREEEKKILPITLSLAISFRSTPT